LQSAGGPPQRAIFAPTGEVILKVGDAAPGIAGATIATLRDPCGQAVVATLAGPLVSAANDTVLYVGLDTNSVRVAAREGEPLAPGLALKKILLVDGNGSAVFFLATVAGPTAKKNALVLCGIAEGVTCRCWHDRAILWRTLPVTVLGTLVGMRGTLAEGRWRTGPDEIGVRLSFPGKNQALYAIPLGATSPTGWTSWGKTGDELSTQGQVRTFGVPGFSPSGVAYVGQLLNNVLMVRTSAQGSALLATKSGAVPGFDGAPLPGLKFKKFADPIGGADEKTAFGATISGPGVNGLNRAGAVVCQEQRFFADARSRG
jgi:hypothetical protein